MKRPVKAADLIGEVCAQAVSDGATGWTQIRAAISERLGALDEPDRVSVEHELNLMLSREEDQNHVVAKH